MNKYVEWIVSKGLEAYYKIVPPQNTKISSPTTKGILVTSYMPIGDSIVTIPAIRNLRYAYPEHHITVVTNKVNAPIFEAIPYIDEVVVYSDKAQKNRFERNIYRTHVLGRCLCKKIRYEVAVCLEIRQAHNYMARLCLISRARQRIGFTEKGLEDNSYMGAYDSCFTHVLRDISKKHDVEKNLDLLRLINIPIKDDFVDLFCTEEDLQKVKSLAKKYKFEDCAKNLVIVLGTSSKNKDWPAKRFAEVCVKLKEKGYDYNFLLVGNGERTKAYAEEFCQVLPEAINLVDMTSIRETIGIMQMSTYYLGGDTGPLHMAAACGVKGVAVYKDAVNLAESVWFVAPRVIYPWQADIRMIRPDKHLPGCEDNCHELEAHCIKQITVEEVYNEFLDVLHTMDSRMKE